MWGFIIAYNEVGDIKVEIVPVITQVRISWHEKITFSKPQLTELNEDSEIHTGLILCDL